MNELLRAQFSPSILRNWIFVVIGVAIISHAAGSAVAQTKNPSNGTEKITFLTADDFPYQTKEGTGATYEILETVFAKLNYTTDQIHFYPWARAFADVKSGKKNTAVFSMTRKPAREKFFDWYCYLFDGLSPQVIVRSDFVPSRSRNALSGKIAVLWRGSAGILRLKSLMKRGLESSYVEVSNHKQIIQMLMSGRADFTISFSKLIKKECSKENIDCESLVVFDYPQLQERNRLYLALSKNFDQHTKSTFVKAFLDFQRTKQYLRILHKYDLKFIVD
ncbi:MAG: transporter substrate-binding domain-containing protein [Rhodospirillaceae bacterium]|jgi:ABC-type amino acid transport substrate-binding protein|nr:transporter substrate-binding domain-containing protein [Rhodospirillaceae bacterium]MBT4490963.1 transporter substrate-binding domain-containing protein [Rhodospirillaceae bacterium]MBT5195497.1 transporter substrate-binding domain-containing protein [Rhodospirillaceae bacterium]MBT5896047.1 transporter substrate-binding domain-containing protein [Rhodospirillaceae bacterium]MBT6430211.1 transporter substrate-binding domain-containing protein [Rhodospirillaceae bacterium]